MSGFSKETFNQFFEYLLRRIESLDVKTAEKYAVAGLVIAKLNYFVYAMLLMQVDDTKLDSSVSKACAYLLHTIGDGKFTPIGDSQKMNASLESVANMFIRNSAADSEMVKAPASDRTSLEVKVFVNAFLERYFNDAKADYAAQIALLQKSIVEDKEGKVFLRTITAAFQSYPSKDAFHAGTKSREVHSHTNVGTNLQKQCTSTNAGWSDRVPWMLKFLMGTGQQQAGTTAPVLRAVSSGRKGEFVVFFGPPGTGKTTVAKLRALTLSESNPSHLAVVQFHPSYTYQQFVEGMTPILFPDGTTRYQVVDGPLMIQHAKASGAWVKSLVRVGRDRDGRLTVCFPIGLLERYGEEPGSISLIIDGTEFTDLELTNGTIVAVAKGPDGGSRVSRRNSQRFVEGQFRGKAWGSGSHCLVIDELNRGNVAQIFGELLYVLSETEAETTIPVRLPYSGRQMTWPENLSIVATMNTADRSTDDLDQALKRRFRFVDVQPEPERLSSRSLEPFKTRDILTLYEKDPANILARTPGTRCSCDFVAETFNAISTSVGSSAVIAPFSAQLAALNSVIDSSDEVLDRHARRVGHSHFIGLARKIAKALLNSEEITQEGLDAIQIDYQKALKEDVYPQLLSICSGDESIAKSLEEKWVAKVSAAPRPVNLAS